MPGDEYPLRMIVRELRYLRWPGWRHPSGHPIEGMRWNAARQEPESLAFTQLTAQGVAGEVLAAIASGRIVCPYLSRPQALEDLRQLIGALRADQRDPRVSYWGLPIAFMEFDHDGRRQAPRLPFVYRETLDAIFSGWDTEKLWNSLVASAWIQQWDGTVNRDAPQYRDKSLAGFDEGEAAAVQRLLDQRARSVVTGDIVNLLRSLAVIWAEIRPLRQDERFGTQADELLREIDDYLEALEPGFRELLYDGSTGLLRRGFTAYEDADQRKGIIEWNSYHNFANDEFRLGILLATLLFDLPDDAYAHLSLAMRDATPLSYPGGAISLWSEAYEFNPDGPQSPGQQLTDHYIRSFLDFARGHGQPGLLAECYVSPQEYSPAVGNPWVARTAKPRRTDVAPLYTLGGAYAAAGPQLKKAINHFLMQNWEILEQRMLGPYGYWDAYDRNRGEPVKIKTAAHGFHLITGLLGTGRDDMKRFLEAKGLYQRYLQLRRPGAPIGFLADIGAPRVAEKPEEGGIVRLDRTPDGSLHIVSSGFVWVALEFPLLQQEPVSLSNGWLVLQYSNPDGGVKGAKIVIATKRPEPLQSNHFTQNEIDLSIVKGDGSSRIPLPPTPALSAATARLYLYGLEGRPVPLDFTIKAFRFDPYASTSPLEGRCCTGAPAKTPVGPARR